eukprot:jgi/Botrbrau1/11660/Bobra.168_2s0015.2
MDGGAELLPSQSHVDPDVVLAQRDGKVLLKATLLKSDHFPGCQNIKLLPLIEGAPNFRQVPGLPVYGVAIPTILGLRLTLDALGAEKGQRKVIWHNMREEPVIYINGRPYVVREASRPFANLEYTGIDRSRVESMEARLKEDVLKEATRYGNQIMVAHEDNNFQVIQTWEAVTEADVQTPLDVYQELAEDGYDVDYHRVPVTDEKAPKDADFALLTKRLWNIPDGAALVFNCQMGRGRTTTGMIIASLLYLRRLHPSLMLPPYAIDGLPTWFVEKTTTPQPASGNLLDVELRQGRFGAVRSLLRVLEGGGAAKAILDLVVDASSAMQNLREAISSYRGRLMAENLEEKKNDLLHVCLEYLERYYVLIVFTAFLFGPSFDPQSPHSPSFKEWRDERPELQSVLDRMLRRNPRQALALHRPPAVPSKEQLDGVSDDDSENAEFDSASMLIANRRGSVLGAHTILKEDHFPGCQAPRVPAAVRGAPNFWGLSYENVYGSALPTVVGVRGVLAKLGCAPHNACKNGEQICAMWYNMREEITVYINGEPFVLREEERPFKNMKEYTGIDVDRLERMETRLKDDVLREAACSPNGVVLVSREVLADDRSVGMPPSTSNIVDTYISISGPADVQTPREVYENLKREGYSVKYHRLPLTDGKAPQPSAFDAIYDGVTQADRRDPVIINCQMGGGRTTTAMVVACLVRNLLFGNEKLMDVPAEHDLLAGSSPRSIASDDHADENTEIDEADISRYPSEDFAGRINSFQIPKTPTRADSGILDPEEAEQTAMQNGEYVGVRRFVRILEYGNDAKNIVDAVVDRCAAVMNLRQQIMLYRRPSSSVRFFRPEINARHSAFKRGAEYLERYCLLIAFAAFLERKRHTGRVMTFSDWLSSRPDIGQGLDAIHQNPGGALAPVPASRLPTLWVALSRTESKQVTSDELRVVLNRRGGSTLSRRSILKKHRPDTSRPRAVNVEGVMDIRKARNLPIYTLGQCHVQGLRNLLRELGARPGGPNYVIVTDLREELVAYIRGVPYLRRELEMPAAALHHAGIQAVKLEELERRLRGDLMKEAIQWGGRVLLHSEIPLTEAMSPTVRETATRRFGEHSFEEAHTEEDVTRKEDDEPEECLAAFWEPTGDVGDIDAGLATPLEVFQGLALEGYQVTYQRVPLSRERTPEAADLDALHRQALQQPGGKDVLHIIVARNAAGSSCRFVSTFLAAFMANSRGPPLSSIPDNLVASVNDDVRANSPIIFRRPATSSGSGGDMQQMRVVLDRSASILGEYRTIMNLVRVLPNGREAKLVVDKAIDSCAPIGNLRDDIHRCKEVAVQTPSSTGGSVFYNNSAVAARHLGLHYLKRYFYLITFFAYIDSPTERTISFSRWMAHRSELRHLLSSLTFEAIGDWQ